MHICREGTSGRRREENETWKGYVRTATIRADQKPVGALCISNSMRFFSNINIKECSVTMIRQLFVPMVERTDQLYANVYVFENEAKKKKK